MFRDKEDGFNKIFKDKENKLSTKLNKLNNDVKKLKNCIEENNNEKINKEKELDHITNRCNTLLLERNQLNEKLNRTKNELYGTKKRLDEAGDDINEKPKLN